MNEAKFAVVAVDRFERPVRLRLPFRFGAATLRDAVQTFVRARIRFADGQEAQGWTAELMVPKWFDKSPLRSHEDNIGDLRRALALAAEAYVSDRSPRTAFGHAAFHYRTLLAAGARQQLNALTMSFGAALADRAILDALCRARQMSFAAAINANLPAIDASLTPDLQDFDLPAFLRQLRPAPEIAARHTVGLLDPLIASDIRQRPADDLPVSLDEVIARYGHRHFKLKLSGVVSDDVARMADIARVLDALPQYQVTLDGNEQFADVDAIRAFCRALRTHPRLERLAAGVLYLEQPLPREVALATDAHDLAGPVPLLIDESDATFEAFPTSLRLGYSGVSSKNCKGPYKSIVNAARCAGANVAHGRAFLSGEDLTAQAGLAVQQDLALVGLLGLPHVERNGHHYVAGFDGQRAPADEQQAFLAAHPDLYEASAHGVRLAVRDGKLSLRSLAVPGFASTTFPDIASLAPMRDVALSI
jgi:hypothetical protein